MEKIIQKAVDGGWGSIKPQELTRIDTDSMKDDGWIYIHFFDHESDSKRFSVYQMILDPLFWQGLAKSCGWAKHLGYCQCGECDYGNKKFWNLIALQFYHTLLKKDLDSAIEWVEPLLNN